MEQLNFDTIILGGGPAGLSAAIYAARGAVSTAIVDINMLGGQPSNYLELENYPGFQIVGGYDLMEKFEEHADKFGVQKFPMQEIENVDLKNKIIKTKEYEFRGKVIIIATGARPVIPKIKNVNRVINLNGHFFKFIFILTSVKSGYYYRWVIAALCDILPIFNFLKLFH